MHPSQMPARELALRSALTGLVFAGIISIGAPARAIAQQHDDQHDHGTEQATPAPKDNPGSNSAPSPMMEMHRKMMADDRAADAALQSLIEKMNAATGDAKIDAMAAVVIELARQRTLLRHHMEHMSQMHDGMPPANKATGPKCAGCSQMKGEASPHSRKP